jgi:hypothetical protein
LGVVLDSAEKAIYKHHDSINERNVKGYLQSIKYPFTYQNYNGVALTIKNAIEYQAKFPMPWDIIIETEPNWSHTVLDRLEEVARSKSSVVYKFIARRVNKLENTDLNLHAIWIVVCVNDEWGVQFRHNLGAPVESIA